MSDPTDYKIGCICGIKSEYVAAQAFLDEVHDRPDTEKVDVDSNDSNNRTTLLWAARNGFEAIVKLLLDTEKDDVDSKDSEFRRTPLSLAAEDGHEAVVKLLLDIEKAR